MGLKFAPRPTTPALPRPSRPRRPWRPRPQSLKEWIDERKQAGLETHQQYMEIGERVGAELDRRMAPDLQAIQEEMTSIKAEQDTIWERVRMHGPASPEERERGWQRMDELGRRTAELMARQQGLRREHLHGLLSDLRPLGQVEPRWHAGTTRQSRAAIEDAMQSLPTSWLQSSRDTSPIGGKIVTRGFYDPARQAVNLSKRGGPKPFESVAFHELGHRFEDSVPGILRLEEAFYRERTAGEALQWLGPGYGWKEQARFDRFAHRYMGKDYGGRFYELLSMGLEAVYTGSFNLASDPALRHLILGMLAAL
jgi:hypothetical protein